MNKIEDIRNIFRDKLKNEEFVVDKTGVKMVEILNANFIADNDSIFGESNQDWNERELEWYLSQSLNVNDIPPPIPKIWQQVATPKGFVNSNYGWAVFSEDNYFQYNNCIEALKTQSDTRRAIMIYNRPSMQYDYNSDGKSDFMCCQNTQHFIRNNILTSHINFRSNDAIHGYKSDYSWINYVHNKLYQDLLPTYPDLQSGQISWNAMSLHIYSYHFNLIK